MSGLAPAVIIGIDDVRGVYAARALARRGVPVIGVARSRFSPGALTNACRRIVKADPTTESFVFALEELGPTLQSRPLLIPCLDRSVLMVSRHRERLARWYEVSLPPSDVVEMLTDKSAFYRFAEENSLPIPSTRVLHSRTDAVAAAELLSFPCVLKPSNSKDPRWLGRTNFKAFKVVDRDDLLRLYDEYSPGVDPLIAQEWIEGADDQLYSCICYIDDRGNVQSSFVSRKLRQWPTETGDACLCQEDYVEDVERRTLEVFRAAGFRGLGYVELKRDARSGEFLIVEPNIVRPPARLELADACGVELLYGYYCHRNGLPMPADLPARRRGVKWAYLRKDLLSSIFSWRRGELSFQQWRRSMQGEMVYAMCSWKDPLPCAADWLRTLSLAVRPLERGRRLRGAAGTRARAEALSE